MKPLTISYKWNRHRRNRKIAAVTMRLSWSSQEKYITTIVKVASDQWDSKKQIVKTHPSAMAFNAVLANMKNKASQYHLNCMLNEKPFNLHLLADYLRGGTDGDFIAFIEQSLANDSKLAPSTRKQHKILIKYLRLYVDPLRFSVLNYHFPKKFEQFLLKQPSYRDKTQTLSPNYVATMLTILKKYSNLAFIQEHIQQDIFKGFQIKRQKTTKISLTLEEIERIMLVDVSSRRGKVGLSRDAFLFSCFTGLAYADIFGSKKGENYGLRVKHLLPTPNGYRLQKKRQKTKVPVDIPLYLLPFNGIPQKIAEKYIQGKKVNDFVFGELDLNSYNDNIKSVAKAAGVKKVFSSHTGRHSFANNLQLSGLGLKFISVLQGHTSITTTEGYAVTASNIIDNALKSL